MERQLVAPHYRMNRRARGGFTLLEILVVIGIILLLVSIGVVGFGVLDQSSKVTRTTLNNLQSMLTEYQNMTDLREQPQALWRGTTAVDPKQTGASLWREPAVIEPTDAKQNGQVSGPPARYTWSAVANTQLVYQFLNRVPANKQTLTKLPSKQLLGTIGTSEDRGKLLGPAGRIDPPLILDAWNNPIIFVGSDGLAGVVYEAKNEGSTTEKPQRVTTAGVIPGTGQIDPAVRAKSWRPFFASAGPDGDFKTGDDNLYSFEQQ